MACRLLTVVTIPWPQCELWLCPVLLLIPMMTRAAFLLPPHCWPALFPRLTTVGIYHLTPSVGCLLIHCAILSPSGAGWKDPPAWAKLLGLIPTPHCPSLPGLEVTPSAAGALVPPLSLPILQCPSSALLPMPPWLPPLSFQEPDDTGTPASVYPKSGPCGL